MHRFRALPVMLATFTVLAAAFAGTVPAGAGPSGADPSGADSGWVRPIGPPAGPLDVVAAFDPPAEAWLAGHRGVDVSAPAGAEVRAAATGRVTYAGLLAGRGVVVVDHGSIRTTYEPVNPSTATGDEVPAGQPIGTLATTGSHCAPAACLHWGARRDGRYVNPLDLVASGTVRLLPLAERTISGDPPRPRVLPPGARLSWPVADPRVTSAFGMRTHPITGVYKLHDGTDFGTTCATPVRSSAPGRVTHVGDRGAYGLQITIDHGSVGATAITTSYSHLSRATVAQGDTVSTGRTVGIAGTSGSSTGCHLHFMVYADGSVVDPMRWLPSAPRRSGARMRLPIRRTQPLDGDVGVDLRRAQ